MRKWRLKVGDLGFDLSDGMPHRIDLRFADDILLFARSALEVGKLLDSLVAELSEVGLLLNADKAVVLTSQSQPPSTITTEHGITLKVLPGNVAQKWLGCMLTAYGSEQKTLDLQYHLQQAAEAYHANKWILEDRKVPISLRYFDFVVSSVACFAGGHRTMYQEHLQTLDINFRKFCRSIVGVDKVHPLNVHEPWSRLCVATLWWRVLLLLLVGGADAGVWPEAVAPHVGGSHSVEAIHSVTQFDFAPLTGPLLGSEALDRYEPHKGTTTIAQPIEKRPVGKTSRLILKSQHHAGYGNGASSNQKAGLRRSAHPNPSLRFDAMHFGNKNPPSNFQNAAATIQACLRWRTVGPTKLTNSFTKWGRIWKTWNLSCGNIPPLKRYLYGKRAAMFTQRLGMNLRLTSVPSSVQRFFPWCRQVAFENSTASVFSQLKSVSQAWTHYGRYTLHTRHAHWQQKYENVLKCCFQSSQFCAATSQWTNPW